MFNYKLLQNSRNDDGVYYPLIATPFGKVPLVAATMTDERERELARKYPVRHDREAV